MERHDPMAEGHSPHSAGVIESRDQRPSVSDRLVHPPTREQQGASRDLRNDDGFLHG